MKESYSNYTKLLKDDYEEEFKKVESYCLFLMKNYSLEKKEEVMSEILDAFLNAQKEGKDIKEITGEDVELYCRNVCKIEENSMILIKILTFLKRMSIWTLYLTTFNRFLDSIGKGVSPKTELGIIVCAFIVTLISSNTELLINMKFFFKDKKYKKIYYRNIASIGIKIICGIIIMFFVGETSIPYYLVVSICTVYILLYYLVIKNNTPDIESTTMAGSYVVPESMKSTFENVNKRKEKRGKEAMTEDEFIEQQMKKVTDNLKYEKYSWMWAIVFGIAFSLGRMNEAGKVGIDVVLDGIMVFELSLLVILRLRKSFIKTYKKEVQFLQKCKDKKIKAEDWDKVEL